VSLHQIVHWYPNNNLNPFKSKQVAQTIVEILVQTSNGSIKLHPAPSFNYEKSYAGNITAEKKYVEATEDWIRTNFDFVKMFTCYEEPKLSFIMYISPFDLAVWISISCVGIFIFASFRTFQKVLGLASSDKSFSYLLFVLGALIYEAYIFQENSRNL